MEALFAMLFLLGLSLFVVWGLRTNTGRTDEGSDSYKRSIPPFRSGRKWRRWS